jgi:hypothetical protein
MRAYPSREKTGWICVREESGGEVATDIKKDGLPPVWRDAMSVETEKITAAKARKRPGAKAPQRPAAEKVKVSIVLSAEVDFKLSVASAALRTDRSALVNQILAESPTLKRFVVQDRAKADTAADGAGEPPL